MQTGLTGIRVWALAVNGNYIFAGDRNPTGVYVSTNNGSNWTQTSLNNQWVTSFLINANNVFAGTFGAGVYLSTNNGTNWTQTSLNNRQVTSLAINGNNLFASTFTYGVYVSSDNGTSWFQTSFNSGTVTALAVNVNRIYAGAYPSGGVYISTDNGTTWTQTSLNSPGVHCLAVNGNFVFAGTYTQGLYLSTDNGTNWLQVLNISAIFSLAINGINIFAGTSSNGVYVSNDNGANWMQRNEGLGSAWVYAFLILNNYIFAGIDNSGVYQRPLGELMGIKPISEQIPSHFALEQNYPNPFNPGTKIRFDIPFVETRLIASLRIYDILGREVAALVSEHLKPGTYEVEWNASNYPSGVYYYKLSAGEYTKTKKMVLVK